MSASPEPASPSRDDYYAQDSNEYGRGLSFFDGIYAFSATLLITTLSVPEANDWRSFEAMADSGTLAELGWFALSFVVITAFWYINVGVLRKVQAITGPVMVANLVAAGLVILIPFTTHGLSLDGADPYPLPTSLYALNIALASLAQTAIAVAARRHGVLEAPADGRAWAAELIQALITPAVFLASIAIAYTLGASAAQWSWIALVVLIPLAGSLTRPKD